MERCWANPKNPEVKDWVYERRVGDFQRLKKPLPECLLTPPPGVTGP